MLKPFLFKTMFDWLLALGSFSMCSLLDMLDSCTLRALFFGSPVNFLYTWDSSFINKIVVYQK